MTDYLTDDWPSAPPMTALVNRVLHTDALSLLAMLPSASVDAFITDLPYGTTACSWDEIIPFAPMWAAVKRTLKPRGVFVTTASQPFTSKLVMSNVSMFKYEWIWHKTRPFDIYNCKNKPLKIHENIVVFSESDVANGSINRMDYYPQGLIKTDKHWKRPRKYGSNHNVDRPSHSLDRIIEFENYPRTVIEFANPNNDSLHPTEKPLDLYEYLILTYTQPNALVVDFCCGSGTTALAARNLDRRFIVGDITPEYVAIARNRLAQPFTPRLPFAS